jgi:hypothetical protein
MLKKGYYFVKSLEEDFISKTLKGKKKVDFQTIENMLKTKKIRLNTKSFGRERRLSTTILHKNYIKTYRPQGIIFKTNDKPEYVSPFDLVLLSDTKNIIVHYYRIKKNIHFYYNHNLIPGFEKFLFKDLNKMMKKYPSPNFAWKDVNKFRIAHGHTSLPKQKYRLVEYNEAVFHKDVKIKPVAIFGYRKTARQKAKKLGIPHFVTAKKFFQSLEK